jgi:NAD(P)-dependent dehydrogenase (short-subunit alcohol dehydrogenase family)
MRTVIITGANVGIGFATAKFIAANPDWHVVLACRSESKANAAIDGIKSAHPSARVSFMPLDLLALASVRQFAESLDTAKVPPIGGLILNAGGINMRAKGSELTDDGFECTFQLNFLGHFLLANLVVPRMTAPARIIFVSSDLHDPAATKMGKIMPPRYGPVEDMARAIRTGATVKPMVRYGTAKLYAMMAAHELDRRLQASGSGITVNSWSPGVVPTTQAGRDMNPIMKRVMTNRWFVNFMGSHLSTEDEAARALGGLMGNAKYAGVSGRYFDGFKEIPSSVESRDERKARSVWEQSAVLARLSPSRVELAPAGAGG